MGLFDRLQDEIEHREEQVGISPADLLDMSPELQRLVRTMSRHGAMTLDEVSSQVALPADEARSLLDGLVEKGHARVEVSAGRDALQGVLRPSPGARGAPGHLASVGRADRE